MIKIGSKVTVPWWSIDCYGRSTRVANLEGTITSINGAYHYVKIDNNPKYDVVELYPNEFKVTNDSVS